MIRSLAVITVMLLLALAAFTVMLRRYQAAPKSPHRQPRVRYVQPSAVPDVPARVPDAPAWQADAPAPVGETNRDAAVGTADATNSAPAERRSDGPATNAP